MKWPEQLLKIQQGMRIIIIGIIAINFGVMPVIRQNHTKPDNFGWFQPESIPQNSRLVSLPYFVAKPLIWSQILQDYQKNAGVLLASTWNPFINLSQSETNIIDPTIASDRSGALHVFWFERPSIDNPDSGDVLMYTNWNGTAWSEPIDIFISPSGGIAPRPRAVVNSKGLLHVVWVSADSSSLLHISAPASGAMSPKAWSELSKFSSDAITMGLAIDSKDVLHVVYSERFKAIKYVQSADGGQSWSFPTVVSFPSSYETAVDEPNLALTSDGVIHVVWSEALLPNGWPPEGVFYARSTDGGKTWSSALKLSEASQSRANIVVTRESWLLAVWSGTMDAAGRYSSFSTDGGITWSEPDWFVQRVGLSYNALVLDGTGTVHLLTHLQRETQTELGVDAMYYSTWNGDQWQPIQDIGFLGNVASPGLTITEGNNLHALFMGALSNTTGDIWYTRRTIPVPHIMPQAMPAISPTLSPVSTPRANTTHNVISKPATVTTSDQARPYQANPVWVPIVIGLAPVVGLIIIVLIIRRPRCQDR